MHPSSFPFNLRRRNAGTRPLTRANVWVLPLTRAAGCGKRSRRHTGGSWRVSKQQVTALGGMAGAWLPSSARGTEEREMPWDRDSRGTLFPALLLAPPW